MKALIVFFLLIGMSTFAQEKKEATAELDTSFKFHSQIFFNYSYTQNPLDPTKRVERQGFNQENSRFYFGFTKNINEMISTKFTLDFGGTPEGKYTAFLKVGKVVFKLNKQNKITTGVFFNPIHKAVHKLWGHRYIKVAYGSGCYWNAVPVGLMFTHVLGDMLKAHVSVTNGNGYKHVGDNDKNKNIDLNLISSPMKGLDLALNFAYILNIAEKQPTIFMTNFLVSYSMDMFKVGVQASYKSEKADVEGAEAKNGMAFVGYLRLMPMKTVEVFFTGYMDDPNTDSKSDKDTKLGFMGGLDYVMTKDLRASLSYEMNWVDDDSDADKESVIWVSTYLNF